MPADTFVVFAFAIVICTVGAAALAGHWLRPAPKDRTLLWIGLFTAIYGARMFCKAPLAGVIAIDPSLGDFLESALNYCIVIPALLFAEEFYGAGWRNALRWLTVGTAVYAGLAILADVAVRDPAFAPDPALTVMAPGILVVVAAGALAGYRPPPFPEWRILLGGSAVFMLTVLNEHAVAGGLVPWRLHVEPLGFLASLGCLAWIALGRIFSQSRRLAAVQHEMAAATRIQRLILPATLPAMQGVRMAVRYLPLAAVAGDFYDLVALEGRELALLLADVSGHGVPAALIASMVKVAFTAELARSSDPARVLAGMNATLCGLLDGTYVTAVCAVLDPASRDLKYSAAGHPRPLLVDGEGQVTTLEEGGVILGIFPDAQYRTAAVSLVRGTRLILYTDGVTETRKGGSDDLFGQERLVSLAAAERGREPDDFADALLASLRSFAGGDLLPHDDVTLLVVDVASSGTGL